MKATEFANFFDFSISREDGTDEDGNPYKYVVSDIRNVGIADTSMM